MEKKDLVSITALQEDQCAQRTYLENPKPLAKYVNLFWLPKPAAVWYLVERRVAAAETVNWLHFAVKVMPTQQFLPFQCSVQSGR